MPVVNYVMYVWLPLFENNFRKYQSFTWRKNVAAVITQDRVIDGNFKKAN